MPATRAITMVTVGLTLTAATGSGLASNYATRPTLVQAVLAGLSVILTVVLWVRQELAAALKKVNWAA